MDNIDRITQLEAEIALLKNKIIGLMDENANLKTLNDWYLEQFRLAQHRRFGVSSEKTMSKATLIASSSNQLSLFSEFGAVFNEAETLSDTNLSDNNASDADTEEITYKRKKRKGKRDAFYKNLPTEQIVHELPKQERICPICNGALHACAHEVLRREVEVIPAKIYAKEHIQTVYGCRSCEQNAVDDAPPMIKSLVPAPVISGSGIASPSLLSFILCNKYVLALPLYRQEQELMRAGIHISRQTMANWIIYTTRHWLKPMYDLLHKELLKSDILHADETTVQVVKENGRSARQRSYMWMYHTGKNTSTGQPNKADIGRQIALFEYQPTRESIHPQNFLAGYQGFLHVDAYSGYKSLERYGIILVECWAHARRKFDEALKALKKEDRQNALANIGLEYCNKLFELEREFDESQISPEERRLRREVESKPVALSFFEWAASIRQQALPKSKLGQAVSYAVNQQQWLMNFLLDGRLELSNNRAERSIRPFTVGRKNWLFSYCSEGAKASAVVYSIIETAQANGLVPFMYLNYLFQTLPNIQSERFSDCLPWNPAVQEVCRIPRKFK